MEDSVQAHKAITHSRGYEGKRHQLTFGLCLDGIDYYHDPFGLPPE